MDSNQAVQKYGEALSIYRGQYLAENTYSEWIYPIRNRYHRLYVQAVLNLMELLKAQKRYSEIVDMCESIVTIEPYEEGIHIFYLEALIELKQLKMLLAIIIHHLECIGNFRGAYTGLENIYRRITADQDGNRITDLCF